LAGCASPPVRDLGPGTGPDLFEEHRRQALKDSQTPEAKAYEREFYPAIGQDLANLLKKCTNEFSEEEIDSFELVFRIDHWGEPKAILVDPITDLSQCVARGLWYFKFPQPDPKFTEEGLALLLPIKIT
jgi:hypothetical protein